jgi:hypothetical protein
MTHLIKTLLSLSTFCLATAGISAEFGERARVVAHGSAGISAEFERARPFDVRQNELNSLHSNEIRHRTTKKFFDPLRDAKNPCKTQFCSPGDVVAIAALGQRPEIFAFLGSSGAERVGPKRIRELVRRAGAGGSAR